MTTDPIIWLKGKLIDEGYAVYITGARGEAFLQVSLCQDTKEEHATLNMPHTLEQAASKYWMASIYARHGKLKLR